MTNDRTVGLLAALLGGVGIAVQSKINGGLGNRLHDGFLAALISFGVGLVLVVVITVLQPSARRGLSAVRTARRDGTIRSWQLLGGVCGAALVASQGLTVATLGVAVFTVAVVAGQSLASLAVDRAGLGPAGPHPLTVTRVLGAALAIVAVVVAVVDRLNTPSAVLFAVLPAVAGASTAWQQAINGRIRTAAHSVTAATLINFIAGTAALLVAVAIDITIRGTPSGSLPTQPWYYLGGALGVGFIAMAAAVVRHTGVLLLGLAMVAGQLVGALAIDVIAPASGSGPETNTLIGVGLTFLAVLVAARPTRRRTAS